jgi:hypothetical protein
MPRPKQKATSKPSTETVSLALSALHNHLTELEQEHQWFLEQIKRKRKELENFVIQMRSLAIEIFHRINPHLQKRVKLDQEIHQLFQEILKSQKLSKPNRKKIEESYQVMQVIGLIQPQFLEEDPDPELDEMFEETETKEQQTVESDEEVTLPQKTDESRKIRQTFLRLAENFHPDKVTDGETQMRHTEIMKEVNRAYQENDLARLLEIEQKHLEGESIESNHEGALQRRCQILEQQNQILKRQYETLKKELQLVKNTPEGAMVSDYRQAVREKIDPIAQMIEEVEQELEMIAQMRDFVKDFREHKINIKEFLRELPSLNHLKQEIMEQFVEEMFEGFEVIPKNWTRM